MLKVYFKMSWADNMFIADQEAAVTHNASPSSFKSISKYNLWQIVKVQKTSYEQHC